MYRVDLKARLSEQYMEIAYTSAPIANSFVEEIPEITGACRIAFEHDINISYEDDAYTEKKVLLADSNFFNFFSFKLLHGDLKEVLREPNSIVLTEKSANKLFGYPENTEASPLGKIVKYGNEGRACMITGIAEDPPLNSHFQFNMILSMDSWELSKIPDWTNNILLTYVKLDKRADCKLVEAKFPGMVRKYVASIVEAYMGTEFEDFLKNGGMYEYALEPVKRIHLYSTVDDTIEQRGSINTIYILSAIVLFILIIACINFMNLSTARFSDRAKEVGVRKSLGASRGRLIMQFLNESILYTLISMLLAVFILHFVLPFFNSISGKILTILTLLSWEYILVFIFITLFVGFLAGSYPSIYLTSFKPAEVLRGMVKAGLKSGGVRSGLVVFQFSISIILIISTLLIYKQLDLLETRDLGFEKENILLLRNVDAIGNNKNSFKEEVKKISGILNASISSAAPPHIKYSSIFEPMDGTGNEIGMNYCYADQDFLKTMNMQIASGRYFSKDIPADSNAVIINEAAAKIMGWDNAVGEKIDAKWDPVAPDYKEIIGVVKDFNFQTLRKKISPLIIFPGSEGNLMLVSMSPNDYSNKISEIEQVWNTMGGESTFDYSFIDTEFDALYRKDQQLGKIIFIFTTLAIIVACLGLLGLATFTAEQRSKEIGIRKSLGASSTGIVGMLSLEYLKLIGFAFLIAVPVSYAIINWWLNNFAFKINIGVMSFIIGGSLAVIIALLSVSFQSVKAANSNPVDSLKYE
jgi:putative ABC transport system permease protein